MENEKNLIPSISSSAEKQEDDESLDQMEKGHLKEKTTEGEEKRASTSEEEDDRRGADILENANLKENKASKEMFVQSSEIVEEGNSGQMTRRTETEWEEFGETSEEIDGGMSKHRRKKHQLEMNSTSESESKEIEGQTAKAIPLKKPQQKRKRKPKVIDLMIQSIVALSKGKGKNPNQDLSQKAAPQLGDGRDEENPQGDEKSKKNRGDEEKPKGDEKSKKNRGDEEKPQGDEKSKKKNKNKNKEDEKTRENRDPNNSESSDGQDRDHLHGEQPIIVEIKTTCSTFWVPFFVTLIAGLAVFLLGNYLVGGKWLGQ